MYCSSYTDYVPVHANIRAQIYWKCPCPGFDPVMSLSDIFPDKNNS